MKRLLSKLHILCLAIEGYIYKWAIDLHLLSIPSLSMSSNSDKQDFIVSLTSYGRRVSSCVVYYTLVSILRQSVKPERIILWLDDKEWNDENLPSRLAELRAKGVEFRYTKDTRSFKKLVPALEEFPDKTIITIDDDVVYHPDTLHQLLDAHTKNPTAICSLESKTPLLENGIPAHYEKWPEIRNDSKGEADIFSVGVGGVLYPPHSLHPDVTNEELFMKLCPQADDIWFWYCGNRINTPRIAIKKQGNDLYFDALYQYFNQGSALTHSNRFEHQNDKQFRQLYDYYK